MKRILAILIVFGAAAPVAHALTLEEALGAARGRPDAVNQQLELLNASNALVRTQGDPLALKMDKVKAQQAVDLGRVQLEKAYDDALVDIAKAYTSVLEAREQVGLADKGVALAQSSLRIARIRLANGGGTQLDVQDAQVQLDNAQKNAAAAGKGLSVALANLEGMIGQQLDAAELEPVSDDFLVPVPEMDAALEAVRGHPQLVQARQGLELARLGVSLLDPAYAAPAQIENAKTQLQTTEKLVTEAQRGMQLQARNLVIQAQNAAEGYRIAQDDAANAEKRLGFQKDRLDAGLIAQVQYDQAQLDALQARLGVTQARDQLLTSLLALQAGTLVPLDGPPVLDFENAVGMNAEGSDGR